LPSGNPIAVLVPLKLVRQTKLHFQQGNSDKVYELDLCEAGDGEFLVNYRYGRRGATLREGTKTVFPVSLAKADGIFATQLNEKTSKGYLIISGTGSTAPAPKPVRTEAPCQADPLRTAIAKRLADEASGRGLKRQRWKLSRVVWRAGAWRMTETADSIAALVPQMHSEMDFWCAAWALGRCGEAKHGVVLDLIADRARSVPWVLAMVAEARAALLPVGTNPAVNPPHLPDRAQLEQDLRRGALDDAGQRELVLAAASQPALREVIHDLVKCLPIQSGTMAFFRQVLKSAEFRLDAELYGQVVRRIEQSRANPIHYPVRKGAAPTVFPSSTRDYLRRRVIRHLRVMGESGDPALFIPLATGVLAACDDAVDQPQESSTVTYVYDLATRRSIEHRIWSPRYGSRLGFTWLLRGGGGEVELNGKKNRWRCKAGGRGDAKGREEVFPELWDQAPDAVMYLLRHARSEEVQRFALRVWRANPEFLEETDGGLIGDLLASWFPETVALGLEIARSKWDATNPDLHLLLAMLDSSLEDARIQGVAWLREAAAVLMHHGDFLAGVAFLEHEDARIGVREVLRATLLSQALREEVVARVLSGLLALDEELAAGRATDWLEFIAPEEVAALANDHVAALAGHPLEACQLFAVRILLRRGSPSALPESLLMAALSSGHASVRGLGMDLLGQLRDEELALRVETLAACAVSRHAELRGVAGSLLKRAAACNRDAARQLVEQWWPLLFRKEEFEGLHESVYQALTGSFAAELDVIPAGTFPRMLESKYGFGQELGFTMLQREVDQPGLADAIEWALHPLAGLRQWACDRIDKEALRSDPSLALKLLEAPYQDTREWAFGFCRTGLKDGDWSPESLVALCDSNQAEVRTFGRELVTRLFREEDGPLYLARLSQHPSVEVQVFATHYLERYAAGHPDRIAELDLYFRTVLSRIGAGRVAKRRVLAFLENQALADRTVAEYANRLLGRQVATVAVQDKAEMIRILDGIRRAWPDMAGVLKVKPMAIHQPS
jgi:hypothetical protein